MLPLWAILSASTIQECVAQTKYSLLNDNSYKLIHLQVLTRHGARSPLDPYLPRDHRGAWRCDADSAPSSRIEAVPLDKPRRVRHLIDSRMAEYPPNCRLGDLIVEGMEQHVDLGIKYREYLVDKLGYLPSQLNPELIFVRATAYDRTYRSALSFLKGLYPPATAAELLDITTGSPSLDVLRPHVSACKDIADLNAKFYSPDGETMKYINETWKELSNLTEYFKLDKPDAKKLDRLCDWVTTMYCNDMNMPPAVDSEEIITKCRRVQGHLLYGLYGGSPETRGIGFSYGMREMFRILDASVGGSSTVKFALLSAHDSTVAAMLSTLGYSHEFIPPLASHIAMEVYEKNEDHFVRFVYNGEPLPLKYFNDQTMVPLHQFRTLMEPLIDYCHEMP